jgi:asparagine synthetase B (glutamine-hydrolysing)
LTKEELIARGPDSYKEVSTIVSGGLSLTFVSSVLALRGDHIQEQPLRNAGSVFCWNGEAWKTDGVTIEGNDAVRVFDLLLRASITTRHGRRQAIVQALQTISGPFAFVFYDETNATVYYGRDRLGRRSLLVARSCENSLTVCSVSMEPGDLHVTEVNTAAVHFVEWKGGQLITGELPWLDTLPAINKVMPSHSLEPVPSPGSADSFIKHLTNALKLRVMDIPTYSRSQIPPESAKVAILFSGGLDCALLARVVHDILPKDETVDLLNVAFENPRSLAAMTNVAETAYELCPDRMTGRSSFSELCQVCPDRIWRFVAINVPYPESQAHRPAIQQLMHPHNTEMDLSIAMALYFAACGEGYSSDGSGAAKSEAVLFTSHARVLLSGLGADELYGGYARHAAAFARGEFPALVNELELDFTRIGSRNLGRDDRVMSHWSKEVRYPYLDEDFVRFSLGLPAWEKCGFRAGKKIPKHYEEISRSAKPEELEPTKMLLRLALWKLEMPKAASERKRAIQFGARTAKMEVGKGRAKGTDTLMASS